VVLNGSRTPPDTQVRRFTYCKREGKTMPIPGTDLPTLAEMAGCALRERMREIEELERERETLRRLAGMLWQSTTPPPSHSPALPLHVWRISFVRP
jgi:hypothetical protein